MQKGGETHPRRKVPFWGRHSKAFSRKDFKTTSPQGDGNIHSRCSSNDRNWILKPHPRKGTETIIVIKIPSVNSRILKPHPRKGTETAVPTIYARAIGVILKPHPRKGTETTHIARILVANLAQNFKTTSPQGDGNCCLSPPSYGGSTFHFKTTSPQGDGNSVSPLWIACRRSDFKTISPQGDGNSFLSLCNDVLSH